MTNSHVLPTKSRIIEQLTGRVCILIASPPEIADSMHIYGVCVHFGMFLGDREFF